MGGPSAEHEVSLKSGRMVLAHLNRKKYQAEGFVISKKGRWPINFEQLKKRFDIAFLAMHGEYGEDGTVQKILEKHGIAFTGSGSVASRVGMDKGAANKVFAEAGLFVPAAGKKFPMVVKPADRGSSVGVSIVKNGTELSRGVMNALKYSPNLLIQEFIHGREFTCGVLERGGKLTALPPTEIIPKTSGFFDYRAKYTKGASREITPPQLSKKEIANLQKIALTAHRAIGARGFSRTDIIHDRKGKCFVLEINTIPGLTQTSLLPQQAAAAGISFPKLLEIIIEG